MSRYEQIADKIRNADAILIGASNGFSITEGINLFANDTAFEELLGDYQKKYGFRRILDGFFYPWKTSEERWAFFSRLINHYNSNYKPSPAMNDLKTIIGKKPYFIVTSNGEGHFELAGFSPDRVYELEGNWIDMRCSHHCCEKIYPALPAIRKMAQVERNGIVPKNLIPHCPECGSEMELYTSQPLKSEIQNNWNHFLETYHGKNLVILELGIGWRNQLIKAPLMNLAAHEPQATYITINLGEIYIAENIRQKSFGLDGTITEQLFAICSALKKE